MTSLIRSQRPMTISCGRSPTRSPRASRSARIRFRASYGPGRRSPCRCSSIAAASSRIVGHRQAVAAAGLVVVLVVGGRDLHGARPEAALDHRVGDDRHVALDERDPDAPPDERRVAIVVRVDRHRGVAEDRLGPRRGDGDRRVRVGLARRLVDQVVADRPERARLGVGITSRSLTLVRQPGHQLIRPSAGTRGRRGRAG